MKTIRTAAIAIVALLFSSFFTLPIHASVSTLGWISNHTIATSAYGMDLDSSGNVYIAHYSSSSIRKYNSSGTFISSFGS